MVKATRVHQPVWIFKIDGLGFRFFLVLLGFLCPFFFFNSLQSLLVFPVLKSFFYHWKSPLPYFLPPSPDYLVIY